MADEIEEENEVDLDVLREFQGIVIQWPYDVDEWDGPPKRIRKRLEYNSKTATSTSEYNWK